MSDEANIHSAADPAELWKTWNESTARMSSRIPDGEREGVFYRDHADHADLYSLWMESGMLFKLWYNATYGTWARMVGDIMCQSLQIPSQADMAHVMKRMAALEERVYMVEDTFVDFDGSRLERIEGKLDRLLGVLEQIEARMDAQSARSDQAGKGKTSEET